MRSTPTSGPASGRTALSARTARATAQSAPSRPETLPVASSYRSVQNTLSPASAASSPNPMKQSTPPALYHDHCSDHCSWLVQSFLSVQQRTTSTICHSREPIASIDALYRGAAFIKSIFWRARNTILSPALISPDTVHNRNATLSGSMRTVLQNLCSPNWCCSA